MGKRRTDARILIYSHDTFGLGHLRRCRTIAHALVERFKHLSVLILSGSPIIGSFDFRARVDFVRVPGVIKLRSGEYTSLNLHLNVEQTLKLRPNYPEAWNNLGMMAAQQGRPDEAMAHLSRAVDLDPEHCRAHLALYRILTKNGELEAATRHLDAAERINPRLVDELRGTPSFLSESTAPNTGR